MSTYFDLMNVYYNIIKRDDENLDLKIFIHVINWKKTVKLQKKVCEYAAVDVKTIWIRSLNANQKIVVWFLTELIV